MHHSFPAAAQPAGAALGPNAGMTQAIRSCDCETQAVLQRPAWRPWGVHGAPRGSETAPLSGQDCCSAIRVVASLPEAPVMILDGNLLAWIEPCDGGFIGAFAGEGAAPDPDARISGRAPATQLCATPD